MNRDASTADAIVKALTDGITLTEACQTLDLNRSKVYDWMDEDAEFKERIAQARARGYEFLFEDMIPIMDDGRNDWMQRREAREGKPDEVTFNAEHVQRSKLRVWGRLEMLKRWDPKKYGERLQSEHSGPNGGPIPIAAVDLSTATAEQLKALASLNLGEK